MSLLTKVPPIPTESFNITLTDVQLASAYYPILIYLAKHKQRLTYGELVENAKHRYPDRPVVQKAIAVSTGRRLNVVRMFMDERELPDITSLIISKGSSECGIWFTQRFDPKKSRERVFSFDWSEVSTDFDGFVKHAESAIKTCKNVKEQTGQTARELMAEYYKDNKGTLPASVREHRELIVELIMEGFSPEEAFSQVQADGT